jgi:uncharacterized coiled-coil protein SlyX
VSYVCPHNPTLFHVGRNRASRVVNFVGPRSDDPDVLANNLAGNLRTVIAAQEAAMKAVEDEVAELELSLEEKQKQLTEMTTKVTKVKAVLETL